MNEDDENIAQRHRFGQQRRQYDLDGNEIEPLTRHDWRWVLGTVAGLLVFWMVLILALVRCSHAQAAAPADSGPRSALLSWVAPTQNTDGTPITQPITYRVYRGLQGQAKARIAETSQRELLLTDQPLGMQCYQVTAFTTEESAPSGEGCKRMRLPAPTDGAIESPTDGAIERQE